jgi:hypothetical protein
MKVSRRIAGVFVGALLLSVTGCSSSMRPSQARPSTTASIPRLKLDPELSPVPFSWLSDDAVLVSSDVGQRKLAAFGNYVERAAQKVERGRLSVWDDEGAWKTSSAGQEGDAALVHKRAEYVKDTSPPDAVERFLVFDRTGEVVYQRDFRSYPLTELD